MVGITVGIGPGWKECAEKAARRMSSHTRLQCIVMDHWPTKHPLDHPYWAKLWIQTYIPNEDLLFFDADMICQQDWNPQALLGDQDFAWVPSLGDRPHLCPQVPGECRSYGLDLLRYGNSGMFLVKKDCPVLTRAQKLHPSCGRWPEQTALSLVIQWSTDLAVTMLPTTYNFVLRKNHHKQMKKFSREVNLHFIGLQGDMQNLSKLQEELGCT